MLYFCRWSGYRTTATFLNTSSSHTCFSETGFCGGQRCHSSSTMLLSGIAKQGATPVWEGTTVASRTCIHRSSLAQVRNQLDAFFSILNCHKLVCKYYDNQFWYFRVNKQKRYKENDWTMKHARYLDLWNNC
jgi:hypothetical protein